MATAFEKMDLMYRYQRYFYDATRKFYLLGRDRMIDLMDVQAGENIIEVGCGTARNLIRLAKGNPDVNFFGLDASSEMLETAKIKVHAAAVTNVSLRTALADTFTHQATFGLDKPFDAIFFSYSISMIPTWRESILNAVDNLRAGGRIFIVDFYDQKNLPGWFRTALTTWLSKFHVQFWSDLVPHLIDLDRQGIGNLEITTVARRYAFIATLRTYETGNG